MTEASTPSASPTSPDRRILLVDCDMFFVQVARLEDPEGAGREPLLLVGGSPTGRGVVTSASYEVRKFGVRSGMPTAQALRLCPDAKVVGVPRGSVSRYSKEVRRVLEDLSPVVQAASVDEFYLDLTGTERMFHGESLEASAWRIREEVLEKTRISVSIGGATRKMLAKMAAGRAKPAGVFVVPEGGEQAFMCEFELRHIPGVGPSLVRALRDRGLVRVEDALPVEESFMVEWFGESRGRWLYRKVRGLDSSRIVHGEVRKSVSSERTFSRDIDDGEALEAILLKLTRSVTRTLRKRGFHGRTITVKLRDNDFTTRQASHSVPEPVNTDASVFPVARTLLGQLRDRRRRPARLLGVGVSNLSEGFEGGQMGLFPGTDEGDSERDRDLSRAVDSLSDRFGEDTVLPGRILGRSVRDPSRPDPKPGSGPGAPSGTGDESPSDSKPGPDPNSGPHSTPDGTGSPK